MLVKSRFRTIKPAVLSAVLIAAMAHFASASVYYVLAGNTGGTGSSGNPWPTIQQAANVAVAGDTVIIENGVYPENVVVENCGVQGSPILFQAQNIRGAQVYSIQPKWITGGPSGQWVSDWVTVQGINFDAPSNNGTNNFVYPSTGWDFEDCTIQQNNMMSMNGSMRLNMGDITVHHCIFQDCWGVSNGVTNALGGFSGLTTPSDLLHNITIQNCIVRRSNLNNNNTGWDSGAIKFFNSSDITVDGLVSYDNNGYGIWLDTNNQNFVVINSSLFGNHSGYYYNPNDGTIWDNTACSGGLDTEANQGPALIQNNALYSNQIGRGLLQNSSGNGYGVTGNDWITVTDNLFADNAYHIWYEAIAGPEYTRALDNTSVSYNTFWAWGIQAMEGAATTGPPASYNVTQFENTYVPTGPTGNCWAYWDYFPTSYADSISEMNSMIGLEAGGSTQESLGPFCGQLPAGSIYVSPTLSQVQANPNAAAVSEVTTPTSSIDAQLSALPSNQSISVPVTITAFGHTPFTTDSSGNFDCELYDLQGRWVSLTVVPQDLAYFKSLITPYAIITGTNITVYVSWKSPYLVSASF